jgi:hypothetical protein
MPIDWRRPAIGVARFCLGGLALSLASQARPTHVTLN